MKKIVWTAFGVSLVLINVIAEIGFYYSGVYIHMFFRIALIVGVTVGVTVLGGTFKLINALETENLFLARSGIRSALTARRIELTCSCLKP